MAVTAHLDFVLTALDEQFRADRNEDIARLRLEHENARRTPPQG